MTDQASFKDGGSRVDNRCELPTILSLQALDGLSAPESRIQAVPETAESGAPMNRDLRNCCDPYLNHAEKRAWFKSGLQLRVAGVDARRATRPDPRPPRWGSLAIATSTPAPAIVTCEGSDFEPCRKEIKRPDLTLCKAGCYVKTTGHSKPATHENRVSLLGRDDSPGRPGTPISPAFFTVHLISIS